jgi:hypothetical protein
MVCGYSSHTRIQAQSRSGANEAIARVDPSGALGCRTRRRVMRRFLPVGCLGLLWVLTLSPAARADPSWAKVEVHLGGVTYANVSLANSSSLSTAVAGGPLSADMDTDTAPVFTLASATTFEASAIGRTRGIWRRWHCTKLGIHGGRRWICHIQCRARLPD